MHYVCPGFKVTNLQELNQVLTKEFQNAAEQFYNSSTASSLKGIPQVSLNCG